MMTFDPLIFTDDYLRVRAVPTCHTSTFVWCHAKGQKGGDWQFMVEPLRKLGHCNHIAFIFPYLDYSETNDAATISKNEALVQKIVHEEIVKGCDPERIAVGGYNEGLNVALLATLADRNKINGVLGITDRLVISEAVRELRKETNSKTPVYVVDRSGAKENAGEKALTALVHPVGAIVDGSKDTLPMSQPATQEVSSLSLFQVTTRLTSLQELEGLDKFIHTVLPVEFAEKK